MGEPRDRSTLVNTATRRELRRLSGIRFAYPLMVGGGVKHRPTLTLLPRLRGYGVPASCVLTSVAGGLYVTVPESGTSTIMSSSSVTSLVRVTVPERVIF